MEKLHLSLWRDAAGKHANYAGGDREIAAVLRAMADILDAEGDPPASFAVRMANHARGVLRPNVEI